jgi:hypothetical protein
MVLTPAPAPAGVCRQQQLPLHVLCSATFSTTVLGTWFSILRVCHHQHKQLARHGLPRHGVCSSKYTRG